jgi:protein-S-isoprenylcysteine O-methyltransferase Ste14
MKNVVNKTSMIKRQIIFRLIFFILIMCIMFFLPARTFKFWQAWAFMGVMFTGFAVAISYFLKHDPDLLERRMRTKEKVKEQKLIIKLGYFLFLPTFILPGFDNYYGWSQIPFYIVIISDIIILSGYFIVIRVFKENSFASRVVEIESGQKVISTGPYSIVRHPMYSGILLMYGFTPVALGSYWALIGSFFLFVMIIFRIFSEEKFLANNLNGYKDYLQKMRYRLIPGIW